MEVEARPSSPLKNPLPSPRTDLRADAGVAKPRRSTTTAAVSRLGFGPNLDARARSGGLQRAASSAPGDTAWYEAGLRFECTKCGRCCTGTDGYVWVATSEIRRMAEACGLGLDDFGGRYLRRVGRRYALLESATTGDCVFLEDDRCSIHGARPDQCRSYPWWPVNLAGAASWRAAAEHCEGISDDARLIPRREIDALRCGGGDRPPALPPSRPPSAACQRPAGLLRTAYVLLGTVVATLAISIPTVYEAFRGKLRRDVCDGRLRRWSRRILELADVSMDVGDEHDAFAESGRPLIIMSNHGSLYDIPLLIAALPGSIRMLTKKELFAVPVWGRAMKAAEFASIDRHDHARALRDLDAAREKMADGIRLWVAPEGTRTRSGGLGPFKKGGFMVALQTGARIVPVGIRGAREILPPKTFMNLVLGCSVDVRVGRPIDAADYSLATRDRLMATVERAIRDLAAL